MALGPDHIYDRTGIVIEVVADGRPVRFNAVGCVTIDPGWTAVRQAMMGESAAPEDDEDERNEDGEQRLPAIDDGDPVRVEGTELLSKATKAPPRYTEGALIDDMQNAWKFVDDPAEKARLKEARGIGTPATRDTIIEGLKTQGMIIEEKGKLRASGTAIGLFHTLSERCPTLLEPAVTARLEARLDAVVAGEASAVTVVDEICAVAGEMIERLSGSAGQLAIKRAPSEKMIDAARAKAKRDGTKVPAAAFRDYDAARAFLGPLPEGEQRERSAQGQGRPGGARLPSPAQLGLAERIAGRRGVTVPENILEDAGALSQWIDANNRASEKQIELIGRLVRAGKIKEPKGYPDKMSAADASAILDKAYGGKGAERR